MGTASMPNWRKHSESMVLDESCRSTNAARAENFLEEERGAREFPKVVSLNGSSTQFLLGFQQLAYSHLWPDAREQPRRDLTKTRQTPILARDSGHINCAFGHCLVQRCYYPKWPEAHWR